MNYDYLDDEIPKYRKKKPKKHYRLEGKLRRGETYWHTDWYKDWTSMSNYHTEKDAIKAKHKRENSNNPYDFHGKLEYRIVKK